MALVTLEDIRAAADRIGAGAAHTPLLACPWADPDRPLWIKPESLQPIGAFKLRGALNAVGSLPAGVRARGVVTHSSGNHAQAVAYAARAHGVSATIVMPDNSSTVKVEATRALGAEIVVVRPAERQARAEEIAAERDAVLIPPYDDPAVIAGQGTAGLEIVGDLEDVDTVLVPVSGGGLASGVATAVKALSARTRVVAVEPELAGDLAEGFHRGERVTWPVERTQATIADGLRVPAVGELPWEHIRAYVDDAITVTEEAIRQAMRVLALRSRLVAEPSGAVATAAYLSRAGDLPAGRTVAILSGGNVEPALLAEVLGGS